MAAISVRICCIGLFLGAWTAVASSQQGAIDMSAPSSRAAREWLRACPDPPFGGKLLDGSQWKLVPKSKQPGADSMLHKVSWVRLTNAQAGELVNLSPALTSKNKDAVPYLLRAVGIDGFGIGVRPNGDVMVQGAALTRRPVAVERRAIIAWLQHAPREVYVVFYAYE